MDADDAPVIGFDLPILDPDETASGEPDEALGDAEMEDDGPRTVLITGACGTIGRKLRAAWADAYDLILIDKAAGPDEPEVVAADLATWDEYWTDAFLGVDTVVHLAANPNAFADWDELAGPNLDAMANVLNASALAGVDRIVFASSNHAMGGYRDRDETPIGAELAPRPGNAYGAAKLMGERLGRSLSEAFDLTFIALRIGWVQTGENRPATLPDDWARSLWLSDGDLIRLFDRAVEADLGDRTFAVVNGISKNRGTRWDLDGAAELIGYTPEDDASAGA